MHTSRFLFVFAALFTVMLLGGCISQDKYADLKLRNRSQQGRIDELESQYNVTKLKLTQADRQLAESKESCSVDTDALQKKVKVLESDIEKKAGLIQKMQAELIRGGVALPPELASELEKFAATSDMITFDQSSGKIKFKSDLLFEKGSSTVTPAAVTAIKQLCQIVNSKVAANFDIVVAGHTDDVPIRKAATRREHPDNWYLSAHRAIAVEDIMTNSGVAPKRISIKGFGQYRPVEANKPGRKGNPKNRRVEIYLVPAGA